CIRYLLSRQWKRERECSPALVVSADRNLPSMRFDDAFGYRKPDSHAARLAGDERREKTRGYFIGDARTGIRTLDRDIAVPGSCSYDQLPLIAVSHRFHCISHE